MPHLPEGSARERDMPEAPGMYQSIAIPVHVDAHIHTCMHIYGIHLYIYIYPFTCLSMYLSPIKENLFLRDNA